MMTFRLGPVLFVAVLAAFFCAQGAEPSFSDLILRGFENEKKEQYQAAFDDYSAALKLNEESPTAYVRRAFCAAKLGQLERAAYDLREASLVPPVTMTDYTTMAWLLATSPIKHVRDGTRAVAYGQKALTENDTIDNHDILAAAYAEMGNFQKARNLLLAGMKKYPDSPRIPAMQSRLELYNQKKPYRDEWLTSGDAKKLQQNVEYPKDR
jgi:tetratricopeptide (TPR) repeat protein